MGDTPAQVTAFRLERAVLFGYVDAAHQRTVSALATLTSNPQLGQSIVSHTGRGGGRGEPGGHVWRFGATCRTDRLPPSMLSGYGWRR